MGGGYHQQYDPEDRFYNFDENMVEDSATIDAILKMLFSSLASSFENTPVWLNLKVNSNTIIFTMIVQHDP